MLAFRPRVVKDRTSEASTSPISLAVGGAYNHRSIRIAPLRLSPLLCEYADSPERRALTQERK